MSEYCERINRPVPFLQALVDNPEKLPVQQQVDDKQGGEHQARIIVHRDPLVPGNAEIGRPVATPSAVGRQEQVQDQPRDECRDERDQASDIHEGIDSDAFHKIPYWSSGDARIDKYIGGRAGYRSVFLRKKNHDPPIRRPIQPMIHEAGLRNAMRPMQLSAPIAGIQAGYRQYSWGSRSAAMLAIR
jgi:hypothetical protein